MTDEGLHPKVMNRADARLEGPCIFRSGTGSMSAPGPDSTAKSTAGG